MQYIKIVVLLYINFLYVKSFFNLEFSTDPQNNTLNNIQSEVSLFRNLQKELNRQYQSPNEENYRFKIFEQNLKKVQDLNSNEKNKDYYMEYDLNIFFDLTDEEFSKSYQLPGEFFNQDVFKPKSRFFGLEDYHSDQIFDEETKKEFLDNFMDEEMNDPVKVVLTWRQTDKMPKEAPHFQKIIEGNVFMEFTHFDAEKEEQSLAEFMSQFLLDLNSIQKQKWGLEKSNDQEEMQMEGRRLQYNYYQFPTFQTYDFTPSSGNNNFTYNLNNNNFNNNNFNQYSSMSVQELQRLLQEEQKKKEEEEKKKKEKKEPQIIRINQQYFKERENMQDHPTHKNPFDSILSRNYNYSVFNMPRNSTDTDIKKDDFYKRKIKIDGIEIPAQLDWSYYGQFDKVKDQGDCNACYIFGANAGIEAHQSIKYGNHQTYSEQEILDCSYQNQGCTGGQPFLVFDYIKQRGIHTQSNYPYVAKKDQCKEKSIFGQKYTDLLKGYMFVKQGIKNLILAVNTGPIVVVKYASRDFRFYKKGVFFGQGCDELKDPNHSALLYGYNFNTEVPYLMFKNNWGSFWGDYGHYKVEIGDLEQDNFGRCLIANTPYNVMPIV